MSAKLIFTWIQNNIPMSRKCLKFMHILLRHHFIKSIRNSNMFQPLKDRLQEVYLIHSCISHTLTHFLERADRMYQIFSLEMIL